MKRPEIFNSTFHTENNIDYFSERADSTLKHLSELAINYGLKPSHALLGRLEYLYNNCHDKMDTIHKELNEWCEAEKDVSMLRDNYLMHIIKSQIPDKSE